MASIVTAQDVSRLVTALSTAQDRIKALETALYAAKESYYSRRPLQSVISIIEEALDKTPKESK